MTSETTAQRNFVNMDEIERYVNSMVVADEDWEDIHCELPHPHGSLVYALHGDQIIRGHVVGFEWNQFRTPVYTVRLVDEYSEEKTFLKFQSYNIYSKIEDLVRGLVVHFVLNNHDDKPYSENPIFKKEAGA